MDAPTSSPLKPPPPKPLGGLSPAMRDQLKTLSIPKEQRPAATGAPARRGSRLWRLFVFLLMVGLGLAAYAGWGGPLPAWARPWVAKWKDALQTKGWTPANSESKEEIRLLPVVAKREADVPPVLTATGKIVSDHLVEVATKVSGQIVALHFEQGDRVEKGQVLARIEDVNYRARRDEAAAQLVKSKANLEYQKINFERRARLRDETRSSEIEYADAKRWHDDAIAQVAADEAGLTFAQKALNDCEVVAPIAGVVLQRNVEVGDFVAAEGGRGANANAQFGSIADMTKLRVEVDVSELDIARLRPGMPCTIAPDAYKDRKYRGRVLWIDPGANYAKATVQVKVRIEDPDDFLRVEGSAQVVFMIEPAAGTASQAAASLWIPDSACLMDPSGKTAKVFVAVEGRLKETPVTLGRKIGNQVEVREGLREGQSIAAEKAGELKDGQRIKP